MNIIFIWFIIAFYIAPIFLLIAFLNRRSINKNSKMKYALLIVGVPLVVLSLVYIVFAIMFTGMNS